MSKALSEPQAQTHTNTHRTRGVGIIHLNAEVPAVEEIPRTHGGCAGHDLPLASVEVRRALQKVPLAEERALATPHSGYGARRAAAPAARGTT